MKASGQKKGLRPVRFLTTVASWILHRHCCRANGQTAAAKAALINYSKALSNEVAPKGVRVVAVAPGFTETQATQRFIQQLADSKGIAYDAAVKVVMDSLGGIPIGRPSRPEG